MEADELVTLVQNVVTEARELKGKQTEFKEAVVNYACIFSQSENEYEELRSIALKIGKVIEETPSGPLYRISPIETVSGILQLLKIRRWDKTRLERGDADFTVKNFDYLKEKYLGKEGFKLIQRENFEMVELTDPAFNVRVYFSNPPLDEQLGSK